jgi:deazaflavin-dependent oxidoreductase (nitroreductase family)
MTELPSDMREHNRQLIEQFRANGRRLGDRHLLLLTTTGRRTGLPRTTPMMYVLDGDTLLVIASNAGAPRHPNWYRNLCADPHVTVEVGGEEYEAVARPVTGAERTRRWQSVTRQHPFFTEHQSKVRREIPVVALERTAR